MGALDINAVTSQYKALARLVPLKAITSETDYRKAVAALEQLLDAGGANERHPLAGLVEALGEVIESFEARAQRMPDASPREALAFLMQQHALKQTDLAGIAGRARSAPSPRASAASANGSPGGWQNALAFR